MPLSRRQAGGHVADADNGQLANLAPPDKFLDRVVIPRATQIKIHRAQRLGFLHATHGLPLALDRIRHRLFRHDMLPASHRLPDLPQAGIRQGEQSDDLNLRVLENLPLVRDDA